MMLTLDMLNCFKDYQRSIHILYHILDFIQQKKTKFPMEQPYMLPILHFRSQCIIRHGIGPKSWNIPSPASEELKHSKILETPSNLTIFNCLNIFIIIWFTAPFIAISMHEWQQQSINFCFVFSWPFRNRGPYIWKNGLYIKINPRSSCCLGGMLCPVLFLPVFILSAKMPISPFFLP